MEKLNIVIPCYNEEELIENVIKSIPIDLIKKIGFEPEIIIINTSTDKTGEIAKSLGAVVIEEPRRGYGRAYKTGFEYVKEGLITTFDADCTYHPSQIIVLLTHYLLHKKTDLFLSGNRFAQPEPNAFKPMNKFGNKMFNVMIRMLFNIKLNDSQTGMWLTSKESVSKLVLENDGMPLSTEIKLEAKEKLNFVEVPITYKARPNMAKIRIFSDGWKIVKFLLKRKFKKK